MTEEMFRKLVKFVADIEAACGRRLDQAYTLEHLATLWERCPFKVGDRVVLQRKPVISGTQSWGWIGAAHFLVVGALATVAARDFRNGKFGFGLHFDDQSWIDPKGVVHKTDRPAQYWFSEDWVGPVTGDASCPRGTSGGTTYVPVKPRPGDTGKEE